jgi:hypothetical protein
MYADLRRWRSRIVVQPSNTANHTKITVLSRFQRSFNAIPRACKFIRQLPDYKYFTPQPRNRPGEQPPGQAPGGSTRLRI